MNSSVIYDYDGYVRRTDLVFRAEYPQIETVIYKVKDFEYIIYCENVDDDFEKLKGKFDYAIKPVTTPVILTKDKPVTYEKIISRISDKEIAKNFEGIGMTKASMLSLLMSKFDYINFYSIEEKGRKVIVLVGSYTVINGNEKTYHFLNNRDRSLIEDFLTNLKTPFPIELGEIEVDNSSTEVSVGSERNPNKLFAWEIRSDSLPEYIQRDEALWYDNLDGIFNGSFTKDNLYFYQKEFTSYTDCTLFGNIDVRNNLFLFQSSYFSPPLEKNMDAWLKEKKISRNEFLDLISKGRLKLVLPQHHNRYDQALLKDVYEANNNSLITEKALRTLQQTDIAQMSDKYLFNDEVILKELPKLCEIICENKKVDARNLYNFLVWPISLRRKSFQQMEYSGSTGITAIGINRILDKNLESTTAFNFLATYPSIYHASCLDAIYFPYKNEEGFSDYEYANLNGELLNFFKYANVHQVQSFIQNKANINSGILPINPIQLMDFNEYIPIGELEEILSKEFVHPNSKKLIESLSSLSEDERVKKINFYNDTINKRIGRKNKSKDMLDLGSNIVMDIIGFKTGFAAVGSVFSALKLSGNTFKKSLPLIGNLMDRLETMMYDEDNKNIEYLMKINKVARLKKQD